VDRLAAVLQIPYLLWLTFAAYLNFAVWQMNL
jgi:tryptophan-rich sensory protein